MQRAASLVAFFLTATAALPASALTIVYTTTLSGAAESPPNGSPGTGTATLTFDTDLVQMRVEASLSGLLGTTTAAHIHCCTAVAGAGNADVASQTPSFSGFPLGVTSGTMDIIFDMTLESSYRAAFITANGGSVSLALDALLAGLDAGKAYFNIHTNFLQGGEIRGFLAVPEPGTAALLGVGLAALALWRRPRRS